MKIGILGGGQLALMLIEAGKKLGFEFRIFDPSPDACASSQADTINADFTDENTLTRFAHSLDAVTFEWENVPGQSAQYLEKIVPYFFPNSASIITLQDRLTQKQLLDQLKIPTAPYQDLSQLTVVNAPSLIKLRRHGYDGKGQRRVNSTAEIQNAWAELGQKPAIIEAMIAFEHEISLVCVRGKTGTLAFYPLALNEHQNGILHLTRAPFSSPELQKQAEMYARKLLEHLDYVGVLAIEFFQMGDQLLINELAPRVHNSGHWSIEGAQTSQFENHLRAGMGLPLGNTEAIGKAAMINLIGMLPASSQLEAVSKIASVHLYGKAPRVGRKLGHVTAMASTEAELQTLLTQVQSLLKVMRT